MQARHQQPRHPGAAQHARLPNAQAGCQQARNPRNVRQKRRSDSQARHQSPPLCTCPSHLTYISSVQMYVKSSKPQGGDFQNPEMYVNGQALARTVAQTGKNRPRTPNARRAHAWQWGQEYALPSIQTKPASRGPATSTSDDVPLAIAPRKAGIAGGGRRLAARMRLSPFESGRARQRHGRRQCHLVANKHPQGLKPSRRHRIAASPGGGKSLAGPKAQPASRGADISSRRGCCPPIRV